MKVAVVGTGYVGLVTGTCLAETGNHVTCVDIDKAKVAKMRKGLVPIYEPELETIFSRNIAESRLVFSTALSAAAAADIIFLALPTPPQADGSADLSFVLDVAEKLGRLLNHDTIVVNKSTVPVGTAERISQMIAAGTKARVDVVSNPEFLREGFAVNDFMKPDRVVIGTSSDKARATLKKLYAPFVRQGNPLYFMDEKSAEMTKYAANSFLAAKISFMNEIANLCELTGADVDDVRLGIGADERIGRRFLFPGIGYGGSCFPKDVKALRQIAQENHYDFRILEAVTAVNEAQKLTVIDKLARYYENRLTGKTFALWGLAFKPDTDDIREAPALTIIDQLTARGARVAAYDPAAMANTRRFYGKTSAVSFQDDMYGVLAGADALVIATEWNEFRAPDYARMKRLLKAPVVFDGRNLYELQTMTEAGFYYQSVGRATTKAGG